MKEMSRAEKLAGLILAAVIGLGALTAVAMPMLDMSEDCGLWCTCFVKPGNRWLTCGVRQ